MKNQTNGGSFREGIDFVGAVRAKVKEISGQKSRIVLAIDGRCASGKTTLANRLQEVCGWPVVHMDDFFLRPEQRTPERYAMPGGNIDHERVLEEVLAPLKEGARVCYRPFDCHTMRLSEPIELPDASVVVVEGSYACHPMLKACYDLTLFLSVTPEEQTARILRRNGADAVQVFREKWIPMEERYFSAFDIAAQCDMVFE